MEKTGRNQKAFKVLNDDLIVVKWFLITNDNTHFN